MARSRRGGSGYKQPEHKKYGRDNGFCGCPKCNPTFIDKHPWLIFWGIIFIVIVAILDHVF